MGSPRAALECITAPTAQRGDFGPVDITLALNATCNRRMNAALPATKLVVASYVVAENALALEDGNLCSTPMPKPKL